MDDTHDSLGQGLVYEDMLPLRWRGVDVRHTTVELARLQETNDEILRTLGMLDEYLSETSEEHAPLSQEMLRVETKLNLLLALVGQLFTLHYPQPPARPVKLSPQAVEWVAADGLPLGDYGVVELYLSPRCPRPLVLPGVVRKVEALPGGHAIGVEFLGLGDAVTERLEKIIFRHHRRSIALARRRAPNDGGA